jgi:ribosomal protein S18 acetylase RimI-like enzyme
MVQLTTVTLRTATPEDFSGIRFVDPLLRADPERARLIRSSLTAGECVVATDADDVVAFAILNYSFFGQGFVPLLVVSVSIRRQGIATQLLAEIERRCVKTKLYLSTNRSNAAALYLFEKCGFVQSGRIENLDLDDDELVFFKPLPSRRRA